LFEPIATAYAIQYGFNSFVTTSFGIASISFFHAFGFMALAYLLRSENIIPQMQISKLYKSDTTSTEQFRDNFSWGIGKSLRPLIAILAMYICNLYM